MIYTLTLNTAIDMNIRCSSLEPNTVNRTESTHYSPNGKGVNVSIVLDTFGKKTHALGVFGGFSGKFVVEELEKLNIPVTPCYVEETTRINVFISDGKEEYKFVGKGPFVSEEKKKEILSIITSLQNNSYLVISGSLPNNIEADFYDAILTLCQEKNIHVILDISHKKLASLLSYKPLLIKPNNDELKEIFGFESRTKEEVIASLEALHSLGAQNTLLTMGAEGLYFSNGSYIGFCDAVTIKLISSACAGDASLAAFLSEWLPDQRNIECAMKKASATGANVAEADALGPLDKICDYMNNLTVTQIK